MRTLLTAFSILSLAGCATTEETAPPEIPNIRWQMIEHVPGDPPLACVFKDDLIKLRMIKKRAEQCSK